MDIEVLPYEEAFRWVNSSGSKSEPHLILGNGFSVAYESTRFSYTALLDHARSEGRVGVLAEKFFSALNTYDFEVVIRQLMDAAGALEVLDSTRHQQEIGELQREAKALKELLATTLASLHPERPHEVSDDSYARVRTFINRHKNIYTANYDLLLYWTLMQDHEEVDFKLSDDGFRSPNHEAEYVVWNHLKPYSQSIFYLHGALHLYRDIKSAELQKLTWIRTHDALIDQIRRQLAADHFPLIVAEGTSREKLSKIQSSDYLSRGLRSLAQVGGGMLAYGLSFGANDAHICEALVNSKLLRVAVSLYGDPSTPSNQKTITAANRLAADRATLTAKYPLDVRFYDASSVPLW